MREYFFEHEEGALAVVEERSLLGSDELAGVDVVQRLDQRL